VTVAAPPVAPDYASGSLASVLPAVARAVGVDTAPSSPLLLPTARRAVVVLVDGLGSTALARRGGHAPYLRSLLPTGRRLDAGFPSTTATSMGSFGTGTHPGTHGLLGYEVLVPGEDRLFNELSWEHGPHPESWQRLPTVFEAVAAADVAVTRIGPGFFAGSGLTRSALRGGGFAAADELSARVDLAVERVASSTRALVYLYWGELDKVGHVHGSSSWEWGDELEAIDAELGRLADRLPGDTLLVVTSDHGMVDVPHENRLDLVDEPDLRSGVRHAGGEPRALHLYCEEGAAADVLATWVDRLGASAWVRLREEAVVGGWFGSVSPRNLPRIGDVVVAMSAPVAVVDSGRMRPELLALRGLHGSLTEDELSVPLLTVPA
jgi:hypothetical protein